MSKIDGDEAGAAGGGGSKAPSVHEKEKSGLSTLKKGVGEGDLVVEVGNVSLDANTAGDGSRGGYVGRELHQGPSLLSQTAPSNHVNSSGGASTQPVPVPGRKDAHEDGGVVSSVMSIDQQSDDDDYIDVQEKITVKIADLGNGEF